MNSYYLPLYKAKIQYHWFTYMTTNMTAEKYLCAYASKIPCHAKHSLSSVTFQFMDQNFSSVSDEQFPDFDMFI